MDKHFAAFLTTVLALALFAQPTVATQIDASNDMSWLDGFTLVVLDTDDIPSLHRARSVIQSHGGRVAILSPPSLIMGWIPYERRAELIGRAGIKEIYYSEVIPGEVESSDFETRAMVNFFNSVTRGEIQEKHFEDMARAQAEDRRPMPPDARDHPKFDEADYLENLEAIGLDVGQLRDRGILLQESPGATMGNSDAMTGLIAVDIFMVESDGSIDPDLYTWSEEHMYQYVAAVNTGLAWWTSKSYDYFDCWCAFLVRYHPGTDPNCQQGYEPISRPSTLANTWVETVITQFGYTSGNVFSKVIAHNTWQRSTYGTDWAYSAFIAYNPHPAPTQYSDGGSAWAYLGGPYTVQLFRSYSWNPSEVFPHETGHIFYACDEYAESGCSCNCTRAIGTELNRNCTNCVGYPHGACMMKANSYNLCPYTPAQVGWKSTGCAPPPLNAPVATVVSPNNEYQGLTTTITVTGSDFVYGAFVDMGPDVTLNYTNFINSTSFEANITVANDAPVGLIDVVVYNRDLQSSTIVDAFEVKETTKHYASPTGGDVYPYITPADAALTLSDAIDATGPGDSVLVRSTTYTNVDLSIGQGAKLYGAWDATFTSRDLVTGKTVLDLSGNVEIGPGAAAASVLDGFEIYGGTGTGQVSPIAGTYGGGVWVTTSTATISNCEIHDCQAHNGSYGAGGGIYATGSTIDVIDTEVYGCSSTQGGGIFLDDCSGAITGCNIHENDLLYSGYPSNGGGMYIVDSGTVVLSGNTIDLNTADPISGAGLSGGGLYIKNTTLVTMDGDVISNNDAGVSGVSGNGGGIYLEGSGLEMTSVSLEGNDTKTVGGGLYADAASTVTMRDGAVVSNTALIGGGAYLASTESYVDYNLFVGNSGSGCYLLSPTSGSFIGNTMDQNTGSTAGGVYVGNTSIPMINNIITNSTGSGISCSGSPTPTPTYCDVWNSSTTDYSGCTPGVGCISEDPLFVDAVSMDYHLGLHSPGIDTGDPAPSYDDPDGSRGDMGIYGSHAFVMDQPEYPKELVASVITGNAVLSWRTNPEADVTHYGVYSDTDENFVPSSGTFITLVAAPDTTYDDGAVVSGTYYKVNAVDADGYAGGYAGPVEPDVSGVGDEVVTYEYRLYQNHPNPFNPTTQIQYEVRTRVRVSLVVFDVMGRMIRELVGEYKDAGRYTAEWDGTNASGDQVSTGVYFYRLTAGTFVETRKMVMLK